MYTVHLEIDSKITHYQQNRKKLSKKKIQEIMYNIDMIKILLKILMIIFVNNLGLLVI